MKIEIHIRDTAKDGKRIGFRNLYMESCRVYKESKDGLRLDNLAVPANTWFRNQSMEFVNQIKGISDRATSPSTASAKDRCARTDKASSQGAGETSNVSSLSPENEGGRDGGSSTNQPK